MSTIVVKDEAYKILQEEGVAVATKVDKDDIPVWAEGDKEYDILEAESHVPEAPAVPDLPGPPDVSAEAKPKRGRPRKTVAASDKPQTAPKPVVKEVIKDDYTEDAQQLVSGLWTVAASIPPTQAYAYVLNQNADGLVAGLAAGAKHNPTIRKMLSGGGDSAWMLQLGAVTMSMAMQTMQLMKDPELRAQCADATKQQLRETLLAQGITLPDEAPKPEVTPDGAS